MMEVTMIETSVMEKERPSLQMVICMKEHMKMGKGMVMEFTSESF